MKGLNKIEYHLFDNQGRFIYIVKLPGIDPKVFEFYKDCIGIIEEKDDGNVYSEYKIKSYTKIFRLH